MGSALAASTAGLRGGTSVPAGSSELCWHAGLVAGRALDGLLRGRGAFGGSGGRPGWRALAGGWSRGSEAGSVKGSAAAGSLQVASSTHDTYVGVGGRVSKQGVAIHCCAGGLQSASVLMELSLVIRLSPAASKVDPGAVLTNMDAALDRNHTTTASGDVQSCTGEFCEHRVRYNHPCAPHL